MNLKSINRGGGYRKDGLKFYKGRYHKDQIVCKNDVVVAVTDMTQDRAIVGRAARIPKSRYNEYVISLDIVKAVPEKGISNLVLYSILRHSAFGIALKEFANGTNVLHLKPELIRKQKIIMPDVNLLQEHGKIIEPIYSKIDLLSLENDTLKQTRNMFVSRLLSGKLPIEEHNIRFPASMAEA